MVPPGAPKEDVEVGLEAKQCSSVFVKDDDDHSLSVEEMFPISSNLVLEEEKLRLYEMLSTYADCISKGPWDLGTGKSVRHTRNTGSAQPIQVPSRRVPFHKRQEMCSQVDEILEAEIIEPSDSRVCKSAFFSISNTGRIGKYLHHDNYERLVHAFISPKLDSCNSLLTGLPDKEISKL